MVENLWDRWLEEGGTIAWLRLAGTGVPALFLDKGPKEGTIEPGYRRFMGSIERRRKVGLGEGTMVKAKMGIAATLILLVMFVLLQNSQPVETRFLFWSFTLSRWVLLLTTTVIGFALGVLATLIFSSRERR
jgi:uncharacterized integral membrane protein